CMTDHRRHRPPANASRTTTDSRDTTCPSLVRVRMRMRMVVALLEPTAEARGVGVDPVERLELLAMRGIDRLQLGTERLVERGRDVSPLAERGLRDLAPLAQDVLG